jgi:signal transduction histidine kinase
MPYSDEQNAILKKVGNVFEQAHTRFLDLQKAEAQARESQIQLALERVRARTMAMQKSGELVNIVKVVFQQFQQLGFEMEGGAVHIGIFNDTSKVHTQWSADPLVNTVAAFDIPYNDNPVFLDLINARARGENFFYQRYSFEEKNKWFDWAFTHTDFKRLPDEFKMILKSCESYAHWTAFQKNAAITINNILGKTLSSDQINILKRFAEVFEQAYTRFLDLQRAEAASKEAIRQAALDRIRADIASMRTVKDLDRITPIIWNELTILGIPFIRCGVFIMNDEQQQIHTFLSTPDGKAIAAFHIPYSTPGNIKQVVNHWHENKNYIDHWDEDAFTTFAEILVAQGALASPEQYLQTIPHSGFYLHFLPFLQGMLYAGNTNQLSEDEINIIQSVANAFSTAYSRYEDFNKLEAAKKQVDSTLNELKSTQSQLIQSEKMASLGELTAGIAHEIQNPLNFVNNFSEVNIELINDMNDENNIDEIKSIANDIKQNSEKILFHGKRADAIVKGMLQHSRTSSGQKEPTDMNALCDEYLRLSYHGLRAKDKNFNAKFETDFDNTIQKINIVPQEIGRVILNLINNAFYAVNEKKKATKAGYEPTVSVSTKKEGNKILISVADNGNGIPEKIKDKIFQPFFTTKPTGQGTGLGLSLSYDIIKAHGGEIKVNTKENEGSEFIIELTLK